MKIEVWFDVACPYCYIGLKHLDTAIDLYTGKRPAIVLRSFELEPEVAIESGETQYMTIMRQYELSPSRAKQTLDAIVAAGLAAGFVIDFSKLIRTNTFNAHRLIHFAEREGKGAQMNDRLFKAYFEEGKHLGHKKQLEELAAEAGINAKQLLEGNDCSASVRADEHLAQRIGISKIPFFLFNGKYSITGAQPAAVFSELMNRIGD